MIEKSYLLALKQSKENVGSCIMHERTRLSKMVTVILDQIGPGQNRRLAFSTFTFKQDQITKSDQIYHFQYILYTFTMHLNSILYIQYTLVMVYTNFYVTIFSYIYTVYPHTKYIYLFVYIYIYIKKHTTYIHCIFFSYYY